MDDILVLGKMTEEHDQRLQAALDRTKSIGMTLNPDKYKFRVTEVAYHEHKRERVCDQIRQRSRRLSTCQRCKTNLVNRGYFRW